MELCAPSSSISTRWLKAGRESNSRCSRLRPPAQPSGQLTRKTCHKCKNKGLELTPGIHMHPTILATFFEFSRTAVSMCGAGILLFLIALWAAKTDIARAGGLEKIVALCNLCFAIPLAAFGAEHLSGAKFIMLGVPS